MRATGTIGWVPLGPIQPHQPSQGAGSPGDSKAQPDPNGTENLSPNPGLGRQGDDARAGAVCS